MAEFEEITKQLGGVNARLEQIRREQQMQGWQLVALTAIALLVALSIYQERKGT